MRRIDVAALAAVTVLVPAAVHAATAMAAVKYANCARLNARYPHGVGLPGVIARPVVTGKVIAFTANAATYQANASLDRDHDGIACEKGPTNAPAVKPAPTRTVYVTVPCTTRPAAPTTTRPITPTTTATGAP